MSNCSVSMPPVHHQVVLHPAQPLVHRINSSTESRSGTGAPCHAPPKPHLRGRARDDKVAGDGAPVTLAILGQAHEEQAARQAGSRSEAGGEPVRQTSG